VNIATPETPAPAGEMRAGPGAKMYGADLLRGIAILMVFVYHWHSNTMVPWKGWFRDFSPPAFHWAKWFYPVTLGWAGVALFFVLSGFCIHLSFLRSPEFTRSRFFWRRFWRIYPAYLVALLVFCAIKKHPGFAFYFSRPDAWQLISHLLFLHDFSESTFFGINGAFWSIATEMQLYLLFPLLLLIREHWGLQGCLVVTFLVGLLGRAMAVYGWGLPDHCITAPLTCPLITWFDWTLGAYVAERFHAGRPAFIRGRIWILVATPGLFACTLYKPLFIFAFTLAAILSAVVLDASVRRVWPRSPWTRGLAFIGLISYSLYLWHQPLIYPVGLLVEK
jgi:peptidoglycan/LPS O-acetylase OafA/YrhL